MAAEEVEGPTRLILIIMLTIFFVMGVSGNAVAFYIYMKKRDKSTSTIFILALVVTDFLTCLIIVPFTIMVELLQFHVVYDFVCKCFLFLFTSNIPLSMLIMVAIAFDRYFGICHPFSRIMTVKIAKIWIVILTVVSFGLGIIPAVSHGVYLRSEDFQTINQTFSSEFHIQTTTDSHELSPLPVVYNYTGYCEHNELLLSAKVPYTHQKVYAFLCLFCFITVAVLYALIYRYVSVQNAWRNANSSRGVKDKQNIGSVRNGPNTVSDVSTMKANIKTATMLFVVTLVFVISYLPAWLMSFKLIPLNLIIYYLSYLNNVVSPYIYAFMSRPFRDDLKRLLKYRHDQLVSL